MGCEAATIVDDFPIWTEDTKYDFEHAFLTPIDPILMLHHPAVLPR